MKKIFKLILRTHVFVFLISPMALSQEGVTDTDIVFGQSAAFKGSSRALGLELWKGSQAYFDRVNESGGIHGRKIKVVSIDDGYEGTNTLKNTIKLIREEKVFNLFGYVGTPTIVMALPAIQKFSQLGIILFSNFTGAQPQREMPHKEYVFNVRSSYRQETKGLVDQLVKIGHKRIGVFIQDDAYGRSGADGVQRGLKEHDLKILSEVTYKRGASYEDSMKGQAKDIIEKNIDAVISIGSYEACGAFIRDAKVLGFKGPIANVSFVGSDSLLKLLSNDPLNAKHKLTEKLINSQVVPPWSDLSILLVKEYQDTLNKFSVSFPSNLGDTDYKYQKYSFVSLEGFINAKVLVEILKKAPKDLNRKNFKETIENTKDLDIGLDQKISFSKDQHQALNKVYFTTVKNNNYELISNWAAFK